MISIPSFVLVFENNYQSPCPYHLKFYQYVPFYLPMIAFYDFLFVYCLPFKTTLSYKPIFLHKKKTPEKHTQKSYRSNSILIVLFLALSISIFITVSLTMGYASVKSSLVG